MATVKVEFKDGGSKSFSRAGYSVFKGKLYIWNEGKRKGKKPRAKYNLSKVRTWTSK